MTTKCSYSLFFNTLILGSMGSINGGLIYVLGNNYLFVKNRNIYDNLNMKNIISNYGSLSGLLLGIIISSKYNIVKSKFYKLSICL